MLSLSPWLVHVHPRLPYPHQCVSPTGARHILPAMARAEWRCPALLPNMPQTHPNPRPPHSVSQQMHTLLQTHSGLEHISIRCPPCLSPPAGPKKMNTDHFSQVTKTTSSSARRHNKKASSRLPLSWLPGEQRS